MMERRIMSKEIDWDAPVIEIEDKYRHRLWHKVLTQTNPDIDCCDDGVDEILDKLTIEDHRLNPDSDTAIDHEEIWRTTGKYLTFRHGRKKA